MITPTIEEMLVSDLRGWDDNPRTIERAGSEDILFVCIGGGAKAAELAKQHNWTHVIEETWKKEMEV